MVCDDFTYSLASRALQCVLVCCNIIAYAQHRGVTRLKASLALLFSNLRSSGSKCTTLKKVLVTLLGLFGAPTVIRRANSDSALGELCSYCPPHYAPADTDILHNFDLKENLSYTNSLFSFRETSCCIRKTGKKFM